jgi:glutathione S-transferase
LIRIHGVPRSRAFRCIWAAEEAGLAYELVPVGFGSESKSPAHLRLHPGGKIPAMEDGGLVLFESLAINLHLAMQAGAPLWPTGDDASRALQWTLWAAAEAEPPMMRWAYNTYIWPEAERDTGEAAAGLAALLGRLQVLEATLGPACPHLLGEAFTVADLNAACVLYGAWANAAPLEHHPRTQAWLERCLTRPAAERARRLREG